LHNGPGQPQIADYGGKSSPSCGLLATSMPVWGLLHMLQALKDAAGKCVGAFTVKLVPIQKTAVVSNLSGWKSNLSVAQGLPKHH
jgi:hypothetical protein